jgi:Protein of unknown function (DUF3800)
VTTYNVYCDESCHLEHDGQSVMVLGAVWCPLERTREIAERIREIKAAHGQSSDFEIKWSKVSPGGLPLYLALLDYFFDDDDLRFRALIVPDKSKLRHDAFRQDHDTWYYKMYYDMLKILLARQHRYRIYLDIKDSRSARKVERLHEVLSNSRYDFDRRIVERMQHVHSHEVEQIQLADLLIGIVSYANRQLSGSSAKQALVARMRDRSGYQLTRSTLPREEKVNLFRWHARQAIA